MSTADGTEESGVGCFQGIFEAYRVRLFFSLFLFILPLSPSPSNSTIFFNQSWLAVLKNTEYDFSSTTLACDKTPKGHPLT
jgi:hypothetical protein